MTTPLDSRYEGSAYAFGPFQPLLDTIRREDRLVLDIGCGAGDNARVLVSQGHTVHGVTLSGREKTMAEKFMTKVTIANAESWSPPYAPGTFDALLLSHVLEHFVDPESALCRLCQLLKPGGRAYIGLPNIAFWRQRLQLLAGKFDYTSDGILDRTHLRFFTFDTARRLVAAVGLEPILAKGVGHCPLPGLRTLLPAVARGIDGWALHRWPNLLAHSLVLVGEKNELAPSTV